MDPSKAIWVGQDRSKIKFSGSRNGLDRVVRARGVQYADCMMHKCIVAIIGGNKIRSIREKHTHCTIERRKGEMYKNRRK